MWKNLPLKQPEPDAERFINILLGKREEVRVPLVEYLVDEVVMKPIVTNLLGRKWVEFSKDRDTHRAYLDNFIAFWYWLGYDCVRFEAALEFPVTLQIVADAAPNSSHQRAWHNQHRGSIASWEDFERYNWPQIDKFDFFPFEYINAHLPDGMGLLTSHAGGIFEYLSLLMSIEGLSLALYEQPDLVKAITEKVGELMLQFYTHLLDLERVVAIFPGDDMGFRSGTLVSPAHLREYFLPWHKRFAALAHKRGIPYFLHSCGNLMAIMEDLITDVGIDGKHSFEDNIMPVQEFQRQYAGRIAVLGGLDMNILAGGTPEQVRKHTRFLIETCGARGRYAIGSGNSIPSYVPVENYLAMVDEALS